MNPSQTLIDFLKAHEGFMAQPYLDVDNVPTIGYGCVYYPSGKLVTMEDAEIDEPTAESYLIDTVNHLAGQVQNIVGKPLTQGQLDALVEFAYNLGIGSLESSTLLKLIHVDITNPAIAGQFPLWCHGNGGIVIQALVERRAWDAEQWNSQSA